MSLERTLPERLLDVRVCCVYDDAHDLISVLLLVFFGHVYSGPVVQCGGVGLLESSRRID